MEEPGPLPKPAATSSSYFEVSAEHLMRRAMPLLATSFVKQSEWHKSLLLCIYHVSILNRHAILNAHSERNSQRLPPALHVASGAMFL